MTEYFAVTYRSCGFCVGKNHCADCGRALAQALLEKPGVTAARVSTQEGAAWIDHTLGRDTLEDILEGLGLLVE